MKQPKRDTIVQLFSHTPSPFIYGLGQSGAVYILSPKSGGWVFFTDSPLLEVEKEK